MEVELTSEETKLPLNDCLQIIKLQNAQFKRRGDKFFLITNEVKL